VYFGGKLVQSKGVTVVTDRLGSVRANSNGERFSYLPYGYERTASANARTKFGTYLQDASDQDYADQRYFNPWYGRFSTADPSFKNIDLEDPGSFNMYAYVNGDPVNASDPTGLARYICDVEPFSPVCSGIGSATDGMPQEIYNPNVENQMDQRAAARATANQVRRTTTRLSSAIATALQALQDPDCAGLFGLAAGSPDPTTLLTDLQTANSGYGYFQLDTLPLPTEPNQINNAVTTATFAYGSGPNGTPVNLGVNGAVITINLDPATPFNSTANSTDRAVTVLHELGHVYGLIWGAGASSIVNDQGNSALSRDNTALVKRDCFK
jgi:RHS repeat-associated protein